MRAARSTHLARADSPSRVYPVTIPRVPCSRFLYSASAGVVQAPRRHDPEAEMTPGRILKTYVALTLLATFASSFIWGINTLFLLDAGLSIAQAFAANAFFTAGEVLFEVPTGIVADTLGRRMSYQHVQNGRDEERGRAQQI